MPSVTLDIPALKAQLREYDKSLPKCPKRIENLDYGRGFDCQDEPIKVYSPCCRPEGHEGPCSGTRVVLGWPGYEVLKELIEIAEKVQ